MAKPFYVLQSLRCPFGPDDVSGHRGLLRAGESEVRVPDIDIPFPTPILLLPMHDVLHFHFALVLASSPVVIVARPISIAPSPERITSTDSRTADLALTD